MNQPNDLTQDWPGEPDNGELVQLAELLQNAAPALPADALARVEQRLRGALDRGEQRQRWRRVALAWSIAAAILLAVGGYVFFRIGRGGDVSGPPFAEQGISVEDRVTVAVGSSHPSGANEQSLVRLDEYRSLFSD